MKEFLYLLLAFLLVLSGAPISAVASEMVNPPAASTVFVKTTTLNNQVQQIKKDMLNQERANRDEEYSTKELAQENVALIHKLEEIQAKLGVPSGDLKKNDLFTSIDTLTQLRDTMQFYSAQLDERNRRRIAQNDELAALRARIDKLEHLYGDVTTLDNSVESVKYLPKLSSSEEEQLAAQLKTQKEFMEFRSKSLAEQYQQLIDYKNQLMRTQEELRSLNERYQKMVELTPGPEPQMKPAAVDTSALKEGTANLGKTIEALNMEVDRLAEYQKDLKAKDEHINDLANLILQKDAQIADLKEQLVQSQEKLTQSQEELAQSQDKLKQSQEESAQSQDKLKQSQEELAQAQEKLAKTQESVDSLRQTLDEIKASMSSLKETNASTQEGYEGIRKQVATLKDKLAEAQKRSVIADEQEKELGELKGSKATLTDQLQTARKDLDNYQSQLKQLNATVDELTAKLNAKDKEISQLKDKAEQVEEYKQAVQRFTIQLALLKGQVSETRQELGDYQEKAKQVNKANIDQLTLKLASKDTQIDQLEQKVEQGAEYKDIVKQLQAQIVSLIGEISSFKDQIKELLINKQRAQLLENLIAKHQMAEQMYAQKSTLLAQLAQNNQANAAYYKGEITKTISYWQKNSQSNLDQINGLKKQAQDKQQEVFDLQDKLTKSHKQATELSSMLDVYQKNSDEKDADSKKKLKEIDHLQGDLQTAQETLSQREQDLKKVQTYFFELEKRSSDKTQELKDKNEKLMALDSSLEQKKSDMTELNTKLASIQDQLNASKDAFKSQEENLKQAQEASGSALRDKNEQVALLNASLDQKKADLALAQAQLSLLQEQLSNAQKAVKIQTEKLKKFEEEDLKQSQENLHTQALLEEQKDKLAGTSEKLTVAEAKLKVSVDQEELQRTQQMLKARGLEVSALETSVKAKESEIERLKQNTVNNNDLQKALDQAKVKIKKMMEDLFYKQKQVERLKMQLSDKDRTIKPIVQKIDDNLKAQPKDKALRDKIYREEQTIAEYKSQLVDLKSELAQKQAAVEHGEGLPVVADLIKGNSINKEEKAVSVQAPEQPQELPNTKLKEQVHKEKKSIEGYKAQIDALQQELKEKEDVIAKIEAGNGSIKGLREQLRTAQADFAGARAAAKNKSDQAKALSEQVEQLNAKVNSLQKKIDALQGKDSSN